jgi:hypothetical protein
MEAGFVRAIDAVARRSPRALTVALIGPMTSLGGIVWGLAQPWRLTLLHPHGQGFWWLFVEPPIWVIGVGLLFAFGIAPGVVADLERLREGRR